jgi:hypothetical protein
MPHTSRKHAAKITDKARKVLSQAQDSVQGFVGTFDTVRNARGATGGSTTDHEQDILRAALVFSAAGLDSVVKELIRGTVRELAAHDQGVQQELEVFVERQLRGDSTEVDSLGGREFLAQILVSKSPQDRLIDEYVIELTGSSLQSADQLMKACKALGLQWSTVGIDPKTLRPIFDTRNKIIHELDVNLGKTAARRNQNSRRRDDMLAWSEHLLAIAEAMVDEVERKIQGVA